MNNVIERKWCTKGTVYIEDLTGTAFTGEDGGHTFVISGVNPGGTSVTLAGTVAGAYILPDGSTQPLTGSIADGKAQVTLDPECYALPGRGQLTIFLMANSQKVAIYGAVLNVARSSTDKVPPAITADVADLVQDIEEARATIPASYTDLMASLAKNYADLTYPISAGTYAWQDGWMYRAKVDIPSAESWTASHWEKVPLADSLVDELSALKSAINGSGGGDVPVVSFTWTDGYGVQASTGIPLISEANCSYTDIQLGGATHVAGYTRAIGNARGLAFLDIYGIYISGDYNQSSSTDWNYSSDVPENAAILRITCTTSRKNDFTCMLTVPASGGLVDDVTENSNQINELGKVKNGSFAHFSFDDVRYCMQDITINSEIYTTIFDNPFFALLKKMHEEYGAVFSLYLFTEDVADYTTAFASDFTANADWLKFGLHVNNNTAGNYQNTTAEQALADYTAFVTSIIEITGTKDCIDRCPRLSNFEGNLESMQAMRDANVGIVGLLASYRNRGGYYLSADQADIVYNHGRYVDTINGLTFYRTIATFEEYLPSEELPVLLTATGANRASYVIMMMHEYAIYSSEYVFVDAMAQRVSYACNWAKQNGYYWNFPMAEIISSTHGINGVGDGGVSIDDTAGIGDTDAVWSANKLATDFAGVNSNVSALSTVVNGSPGQTIDVTSQGTWVNDHGINGNTGSINNESTSYKEYQLGDAVHVAGYTRGGADLTRGMAFYTASGAYISGDNHYPSDTGYDWNYSFDVPQNAAIFRITCAKSYQDRFTCQFTFSTSEGLISKVSTLETKVQTIEEELDNLDVDVDINDLGSALSYRWVDGYAVSPSFAINNANRGKLIVAGTQSVAIADASGCAGGIIYGHTRLGDDYAIGFYDTNGVLISGEKRPSALDYEWDFSLPVPKYAKTVIITCKTTSKNLFSVTGKGTAKAVEYIHRKASLEYECPNDVFGLDSARSDFHFDSATRLQDMYTWFDILVSTFPRNITRVQIGTTTTPDGSYATIDSNTYPIYAYVIQGDSYVAGNDFIIASGIHGDESVGDGIQSVVSVAYFIRDMLCNPGKNEYLRFMKWNCKILVIPVMNPWGYQNGKRCNGRGVDVNRNYDINFDPTYESYGYSSGTSAFSENESAAVATYISENFANAKFCTELHTRGGNVLPNDDRWFTTTTSDNSIIQSAVSEVGYYMRHLFGGTVSNGQQDASALPPTFRAYVDHVISIPANLIECAKSVNMDITTFNSDLVQRQYVQYLGAMIQKLCETYVG